ncbi:resolvase [Thermoleptolyngbya sp. C42_A2020_037]|uniref:resolvase n=2 Tax=Cyanophyceae TaxID=3028117 RepID=UPI001A0CF6B2|nr:resolvase [Thermoleptolyngbya sp. C42_A2020_037]MBF2085881.1 resolvase [Thermoleptolyngbya sp. C42_A2020_037]
MDNRVFTTPEGLLTVEAAQKVLNRSRASVYRYANTDPNTLNPPYDPSRLNPELRQSLEDPILFHPNEVARFAADILGMKQVTIQVQESAETTTHKLLRAILSELQSIRELLESKPPSRAVESLKIN